jgi:hypothetical protein
MGVSEEYTASVFKMSMAVSIASRGNLCNEDVVWGNSSKQKSGNVQLPLTLRADME